MILSKVEFPRRSSTNLIKNGRYLIRKEVIVPVLEFIDKLAANPDFRDIIGKEFMPSCVALVQNNISDPAIVKPGIVT